MTTYKVNNRTTLSIVQVELDCFGVIIRNGGRLGTMYYCDFEYLLDRYPSLKNQLLNDFNNKLVVC